MSLNNALIYPVNKIPPYTKKESSNKTPTNIINLFLPGNQLGSASFKLNEKILPKLLLSKKGFSLKNLNIKHKIPLIKYKSSKISIKEKPIIKSNSENKNIFENFFNKMNSKRKNNSFCYQNNIKNSPNASSDNYNSKNEKFKKIKLNIKDSKHYYGSRNKYHKDNSEILMYLNKNMNINNSNITLNKQNKKIKLNKSYLIKNKSNFIPKYKTKINLTLYINQQKNSNYINNKYKIKESKTHDKINTYANIQSNISDKENINNINISYLNESNIN